jgi:hypothetical protein
MRLGCEMLALYCFCAGTACGVGKLLGYAGRIRLLQARTVESWALAAWLGTGLLFSVFGWSSYLGLPGRSALLVVGLVVLGLLGVGLVRRCGRRKPVAEVVRLQLQAPLLKSHDFSYYRALACLLLAALLSGGLALLPIPVGQGYDLANDAATYIAVSEWLQDHAFGPTVVGDPGEPLSGRAAHFQQIGHRLGATFYHAFVTACIPKRSSLDTYLPVTAWGCSLNMLGIFLLARWAFAVPRRVACPGVCLVALMFSPLATAASFGIMHQLYGTAGLVFTLALATRATHPRGPWSVMLLVSFSGSAWLAAYSEMLPLLLLVLAGWTVVVLLRARRVRVYASLGGLALAAGLLVLLTTHELVRLTHRLDTLNAVMGSPRPWSGLEFWAFAVGAAAVNFYFPLEASWPGTVLGSVLLGLAFLRLFRLRSAPVFLLAGVCLVLAGYFRLAVRDPWSGEWGHTWHLFKVCNWAYPLVAVLQLAGLRELLTRAPRSAWILTAVCLAAATWSLPQHHRSARQSSAMLREMAQSDAPLTEGRALVRAVRAARTPWVYLINDHPGQWSWQRALIGLCLSQNRHPNWYRFANDWRLDIGSHMGACFDFEVDRPLPDDPSTLLVLTRSPYARAQDSYRRLPWGLTVLPAQQPVIFDVRNPQGLERRPDGGCFFWLGPDDALLRVWSPWAAAVLLCCDLAPGPSLPAEQPRTLELSCPGVVQERVTLQTARSWQVPVQLRPGVNDIQVRSLTPASRTLPANGYYRHLHVCVSGWQVLSVPTTAGNQ